MIINFPRTRLHMGNFLKFRRKSPAAWSYCRPWGGEGGGGEGGGYFYYRDQPETSCEAGYFQPGTRSRARYGYFRSWYQPGTRSRMRAGYIFPQLRPSRNKCRVKVGYFRSWDQLGTRIRVRVGYFRSWGRGLTNWTSNNWMSNHLNLNNWKSKCSMSNDWTSNG